MCSEEVPNTASYYNVFFSSHTENTPDRISLSVFVCTLFFTARVYIATQLCMFADTVKHELNVSL